MIKVKIKNIESQQITNEAKFDTQLEVDTWLDAQKADSAFGKNERWVTADSGENIENSIDVKPPENEGDPILYKMPADYEVIQEDATAEATEAAKNAKRDLYEAFGKEFRRWIQRLNESSNITPEQVIALRENPKIAMANTLADQGEIPSLKTHIDRTDWTGLFPPAVVQAAQAKINAFLAANP